MASLLTQVRTDDCGKVHASEEGVKAFVNSEEVGTGKLCIAESSMCWKKSDGQGLCLPYPAISLHAVSRDLDAFLHECLYLMIDPTKLTEETPELMNEDEEETEEEEKIMEIRFVPSSGSTLAKLFEALSECQLLHPDPEDEDLSDDYIDAEEAEGREGETAVIGGGGDGTEAMQQLTITGTNGHHTTNGQHSSDTTTASPGQSQETGQFDDADNMQGN